MNAISIENRFFNNDVFIWEPTIRILRTSLIFKVRLVPNSFCYHGYVELYQNLSGSFMANFIVADISCLNGWKDLVYIRIFSFGLYNST